MAKKKNSLKSTSHQISSIDIENLKNNNLTVIPTTLFLNLYNIFLTCQKLVGSLTQDVLTASAVLGSKENINQVVFKNVKSKPSKTDCFENKKVKN